MFEMPLVSGISLGAKARMGSLIIRQLSSLDALQREATAWNDLWSRSHSVRPTARAEHLAIWHESFATGRPLRAIVVEDEGRLVAALPLVEGRVWGLPAALTMGNAWTPAGELLLDTESDAPGISEAVLNGLRSLAPGLVAIDGLVLESPVAIHLSRRLDDEQVAHVTRRRFSVPLVEIAGGWPAYLASRSRNHRRKLRNILRRAEQQGGVVLARHEVVSPGDVDSLLEPCFELEAAGWKGRESSAVLNVREAREFFVRQARELAAAGELNICLLRQGGRLIAFEYGWNCRGVRAVLKIGYDESAAWLSPGQLLRCRLLEQLLAEEQSRWIDYVGPASEATAAWATHRYDVGRVVLATSGVFAGAAVAGSRYGGPLVRRLRGEADAPPFVPRPVPEAYAQETSASEQPGEAILAR
jgi:CelD/BcsL family acetyltransferase involved in cellulose biosynthesis